MKKTTLIFGVMCLAFRALMAQTSANALNFDGSNDYVARSIFSTQNFNITYEARIKFGATSLPIGNRYILANGTGTTGFGLFLTPTNSVCLRIGAMSYTSTYVMPTNTFVLLSVVVTPNQAILYVNGVQHQTFTGPVASTPTGSFYIGTSDGTTEFFGGDIDEVRYWIRAVCPQEIQHRANCSATGLEPQAAAIYKFNQGVAAGNNSTVTSLTDITPNMHNAQLFNFALNGSTSNWINSSGAYAGQCSIAPLTLSISVTPTNIICAGQSVTMTALGGSSYTWNTNQTNTSIAVTPSASGIYSVIGLTGSSCYGMAMTAVSLIPLPTITVNSATICTGSSATLNAGGASSYTWNTGANTSSIVVSPTSNTTYTVTGSNGNCSNSQTTQVTVLSVPNITVNAPTICSGNSVMLTASGASSYTWNTGANSNTIMVNPSVTTVYTVTGSN
ncbi:MAG: LamG domain-containing protein, partial [Bacteroidia bacterium]|nr:LamG domain-containing protein [Bacteroidia bacterium]